MQNIDGATGSDRHPLLPVRQKARHETETCGVEEHAWKVAAEVKYQNLRGARVSVNNTYVWP